MAGQIAFAKQKPDKQRQSFGKIKNPAKKPGMFGDKRGPRKALVPPKKGR